MKKRMLFLGLMAVCLSAGLSWAEDPVKVEPSMSTMEEVVVTATRQEEKISSVPANVSVITENDIKNSTASNIPDLLRTQVGVHVNDITGNNRSFTVDLRGFGETAPSNTLVLVDGRRINQADLSGTDWALIPLDRVKKIEIIRGGRGSVLYGDNAAGGVVNIITKEGEAFHTGAEISGGSYDTFKGSAYVSGAKDKLSYTLSGSYLTSDGYRDNSDTEAKDIGGNLNYDISDRMSLNFSTGYHKDDTGMPGGITKSQFQQGASRTDTFNPDNFFDVEDSYIKGTPKIFFLNDSLLKMDVSFRKRKQMYFSSFYGGTYEGDTEIETVSVSPQIVLKEKLFGFKHSLIVGFDFENAKEDVTNTILASTEKEKLEKENYGYYIHEEINLTNRLAISGGYRYDRAEFNFDPWKPDNKAMDENLYTGGINYNFYKNSYAYVSFSHSFRYPVLDEFFNYTTNRIQTDLKPQTSDDYEFGIRHYITESLFAIVNLFRIETKDEILYDPAADLYGANVNLDGKTRRDGVEVSLTQTFKWATLGGSYTFTKATIEGGQYEGKDFPNVPEHQFTFNTLFSLPYNFSVAVNGIYVGKRPFTSDFENEFDDQDDYFVLNTKIMYRWKKLNAFLNINNLTDKEYSEFGVLGNGFSEEAFYPSPKINFLFGISAEF